MTVTHPLRIGIVGALYFVNYGGLDASWEWSANGFDANDGNPAHTYLDVGNWRRTVFYAWGTWGFGEGWRLPDQAHDGFQYNLGPATELVDGEIPYQPYTYSVPRGDGPLASYGRGGGYAIKIFGYPGETPTVPAFAENLRIRVAQTTMRFGDTLTFTHYGVGGEGEINGPRPIRATGDGAYSEPGSSFTETTRTNLLAVPVLGVDVSGHEVYVGTGTAPPPPSTGWRLRPLRLQAWLAYEVETRRAWTIKAGTGAGSGRFHTGGRYGL